MAKSFSKTMPKILDILLVLVALYIVVTTCAPSVTQSITASAGEVSNAAVNKLSTTAEDLLPDDLGIPLPPPINDLETIPQGLTQENFTSCCPPGDDCPEGMPKCESFAQTATPAVMSQPAGSPQPAEECPTLIYTEETLPTSNAETGCWPSFSPYGRGAVTADCLGEGNTVAANFYDAEQTNVVYNAISSDPTRQTQIRNSNASPNYNIRKDPPIPWRGAPVSEWGRGNSNFGFSGN